MAAVAPQMEHAPVPSFQYTTASSWQRVRHRDEEEDDDDDEDEDDGVLSTSYCDRQPPYSDFGYDTGLRLRYSHCQISKARTLGTDQHLLKTLTN